MGLAGVVHNVAQLGHGVHGGVLAHGGHGAVVWAQVCGHGVVLALVQVCDMVWQCDVFVLLRTLVRRTEPWL